MACVDHRLLALDSRMAQTMGAAAVALQTALDGVAVVGGAAAKVQPERLQNALGQAPAAAARGLAQVGAPSKFAQDACVDMLGRVT